MPSPYARHRPVENLILVRERDRRKARELALVLLGLLPVAASLLGYTWLQTAILQRGYEIRDLERRIEELSRTERQLELEISNLSSPERVVSEASGSLEMVFPSLEQMVFLEGW